MILVGFTVYLERCHYHTHHPDRASFERYGQSRGIPLDKAIHAVRADRIVNVPVALTREEVAKILPVVDGDEHVVVIRASLSKTGRGWSVR